MNKIYTATATATGGWNGHVESPDKLVNFDFRFPKALGGAPGRCCPGKVDSWRERGEITYSKLGGKIYYRLSDILALIKNNEISAIKSRF